MNTHRAELRLRRTLAASLIVSVSLNLAGGLSAQADPTRNEVLGLTLVTGTASPSLLRQRMDYKTCATTSCQIKGFEKGAAAWAGGAAFNSDVPPNLTKSVGGCWVSNGKKIALVNQDDCAIRCASQNAPLSSSSAVVTGLAYWEDQAALLMSDSDNLLYWVDTTGCTLKAVACDHFKKNLVPSGYTIAGLASDDVNRRLFVSAAKFGSTTANKIWVAQLGFPAKPVASSWCKLSTCEVTIPTCKGVTLGPITGLGYDACTSTLYYTDGKNTVASRFAYDAVKKSCSLTLLGCCSRSSGDPVSGLCVLPKQPEAVGTSCVAKPCINCPKMVAGTYGAAFLGNKNFALTLSHAPTGSNPAYLAIGYGGCTTPGVNLGFCSAVRVPLKFTPLLIAMRVTKAGAGPCDGTALFSVGVPRLISLCGVPISAQWGMDCSSSKGTGNAISNCVNFEITTN